MLLTEDLTKKYDDILALDGLNIEVTDGEIFSLLGANGAGKTTTLNLILNFINPTSGTATVNEINVVDFPKQAKRHMAYLSESVVLYGNMSARQNLIFFTELSGRRCGDADYVEVMHRVGLPERSFDARLKTFSKGMRQRLGMAIVILKNTPLILLDEPMSGLDPKGIEDFAKLLRELRTEGKTVLMSTHEVFTASEISDRVGIMRDGKLVTVRTADQLAHDDLRALYLACMSDEDLAR